MKLEDFKVGQTFYGPGGFKWLCTDKGTRVIIAIMLDYDKKDYWFKGPPYSVEEKVFDEYDMKSLYTDTKEILLDSLNNIETSSHPNFDSKDVIKMMKEKDRNYPRKKLLMRNRVNTHGHILYPYAAIKVEDTWFIRTFELFSKTYSEMNEDDFVQLPLATEEDIKKRKELFYNSK
jgi:hypothetical protein